MHTSVRGSIVPAGQVYSLLMTANGALWVSFEKELARVAAGTLTIYDYDKAGETPLGSVEHLREAPDGAIWAIADGHRLIRFARDGIWHVEPTPSSDPIAGLFVDSANTLWLVQNDFLHIRARGRRALFGQRLADRV